MMASAPVFTGDAHFFQLFAMSAFAEEVPMFAFIFMRVPAPMASGSMFRFALRAITMVPSETALRICSGKKPLFPGGLFHVGSNDTFFRQRTRVMRMDLSAKREYKK